MAVLAHAASLDAGRTSDLVQRVEASFETFLVGLEDIDAELARDMHASIVALVVHLGGGRLTVRRRPFAVACRWGWAISRATALIPFL